MNVTVDYQILHQRYSQYWSGISINRSVFRHNRGLLQQKWNCISRIENTVLRKNAVKEKIYDQSNAIYETKRIFSLEWQQ